MSQELSERSVLDRSARKRVSGRSSRIHSTSNRFTAKEDDLTVARSKLDNILDSIARGEETFDEDYFDEEPNGLSSPVKSKRSRGPRKTRKRTREDDYSKSSMFILKLFDRTVDLSEFCSKYIDSDPPLYPICRAWARNNDTSTDQGNIEEDQSGVSEVETSDFGGPEKPTGKGELDSRKSQLKNHFFEIDSENWLQTENFSDLLTVADNDDNRNQITSKDYSNELTDESQSSLLIDFPFDENDDSNDNEDEVIVNPLVSDSIDPQSANVNKSKRKQYITAEKQISQQPTLDFASGRLT